ncbi:hypothetical protein H2200_010764 [Cladophialophora chaetospira]|uniref:Methyltransferase domain-containing protein n=1 Tax=Cladophialophora chaetospira TaxID=386627 RepID=A0AA38X0Q4_9EURO|nr:hypothetical protein H2200_010764 [Cladophialophora chaetospira]
MSDSAPTQYDLIGRAYESMKKLPAALLERDNLRAAVTPYLHEAKVLDLACGTGYYSRLLLDWGASKIVGVDISSTMVDAALKSAERDVIGRDKLSFHVGDATNPLPKEVMAQGPFDIVLGAWFLNYADNVETMTAMFRNISSALKSDGVFVGITPHPASDLDSFAELHGTAEEKAQMKHFGVSIEYVSALENGQGYNTRVTGHTQPTEIKFKNFHLRREAYERAAKEGGMNGKVEWRAIVLPDNERSRDYGVGSEYWEGYERRPHFGIMVVAR